MATHTLLTVLVLGMWFIGGQTESKGEDVSVKCNKNDMTVYLRRDFLMDFYLEDLRLRDTGCTFQNQQNRTHFILSVPLTSCGTSSKHTNESLIYTNIVRQRPLGKNVFINRMPALEIPLRCAYAKKIAATYVDLEMRQKTLDLNVKHGLGEFTLKMTLYLDASYSNPISQEKFPLSVTINQRLFFQLEVDSPDEGLSIIADRCYATPTPIPSEDSQYDIIANRCARDATLQIHPSVLGTQRFSFQSFQFIRSKGPPYVFIHCEVRVCDADDDNSKCARGCNEKPFPGRRLRRSADDEEGLYDLEQGPLVMVLVERKEPSQLQNDKDSSWKPWVLVAMGIVCLMCVLVVGYTRRELHKAGTELHHSTRESKDCSSDDIVLHKAGTELHHSTRESKDCATDDIVL